MMGVLSLKKKLWRYFGMNADIDAYAKAVRINNSTVTQSITVMAHFFKYQLWQSKTVFTFSPIMQAPYPLH